MERDIRLDYLCTNYGKKRFLNWCRSLNIFRFCKTHPYPDDLNPDRFIALTSFKDEEDLENLLDLMKIHVKGEIEGDFTYLANIENTLSTQAIVNEVQCYISINKVLKTIVLDVSGTEENQFLLDNSTFQRVKKMDDFFSTLNIDFISSPHDDDYCITPEFYPELWK